MTSKMSFGVRQVRDFLAANGCVLTVRGYDYTTNSAIVPDLDDIKIKRMKVCNINTIDDLDGFVSLSGFKTVSEWWVQIKRFCKGTMWLYRVQIDNDPAPTERRTQRNPFASENIAHPLDIRGIDADPALVDLKPYKDAAHDDRIQREARQAERHREHMKARYEGQGQIRTFVRMGA